MTAAMLLAGMELRQQLRSPVFWIVAGIALLMVIGSALIDALRIEATSSPGGGAALVFRVHLVWTLFYLFTAAALVGDAVTRDVESGFAPIVRATPLPAGTYRLGRFIGATAALLLCFVPVPLGLLVAHSLPGAHPDWATPVAPAIHAAAMFGIAVPNLLIIASLFLALATATGSMSGCLVGAVLLLTLYGLRLDPGGLSWLYDPLGFAAADRLLAGDMQPLLVNRALWLAVAVLLVALTVRLPAHRLGARRSPRMKQAAARPPPALWFELPAPAAQFGVRLRHHLAEVTNAGTFRILLALGLASSAANLWPEIQSGAPLQTLLTTLIDSFQLVPIVVVLFFAGEIHWSDRAHRIDGIVRSLPAPAALLLFAQFAALGVILLLLALVTGAALPLLLMLSGRPPDLLLVLSAYVLPKAFDWLLLGILALWLQSLSPGKLAGWGYLVLFLIATLALDQAGFDSPLIHYGRYPGAPLPPALTGDASAYGFQLLWAVVAALLLSAALTRAGRPR